MGTLFPEIIGKRVISTRQEVFYIGTPAGDRRFHDDALPVWVELGASLMYAIPGNANRGLKIGDDTSGPVFDPTNGDRQVTGSGLKAIRAYLRRRLPALAKAPLVGSEVCQYEATPDSHYIIDRHPSLPNVWLAGGGSGHGFKMGPAIGEIVTAAVLDGVAPDPTFALARLRSVAPRPPTRSGRERGGRRSFPQISPIGARGTSGFLWHRTAKSVENSQRPLSFDTMAGTWPA